MSKKPLDSTLNSESKGDIARDTAGSLDECLHQIEEGNATEDSSSEIFYCDKDLENIGDNFDGVQSTSHEESASKSSNQSVSDSSCSLDETNVLQKIQKLVSDYTRFEKEIETCDKLLLILKDKKKKSKNKDSLIYGLRVFDSDDIRSVTWYRSLAEKMKNKSRDKLFAFSKEYKSLEPLVEMVVVTETRMSLLDKLLQECHITEESELFKFFVAKQGALMKSLNEYSKDLDDL